MGGCHVILEVVVEVPEGEGSWRCRDSWLPTQPEERERGHLLSGLSDMADNHLDGREIYGRTARQTQRICQADRTAEPDGVDTTRAYLPDRLVV